MTPPRPLVVQCEDLDPAPAAWLRERCDVAEAAPADTPEFRSLLARADALVVRTYTRVDAALIGHAPRLRVVARAGVGLDNIDLSACAARGIAVVHTPDANTTAVAEYVFAMLHDALRPRAVLGTALTPDQWLARRRGLRAARQLCGLTLGVWGLGRIGKAVARIGVAYGMRVVYTDLLDIPPGDRAGATPVGLATLLAESDVLSIHVDDRPSNARLLNESALAMLRNDVVIVNAARGFLVDAPALAGFLRSHPAATALLDVHDPEPFGTDYPLLGLPNARLSPHIAAATATAQESMSWVVRDLWRVLQNLSPVHPAVIPPAAPPTR